MRASRIIARTIGTAAAVWWLFSLISSMVLDFGTPLTLEAAMMVTLVLGSIAGVILAWFREGPGGIVLGCFSVSLSIFAYFSAGHNRMFAVVISGLPFVIAGIMFLILGYGKKKSMK